MSVPHESMRKLLVREYMDGFRASSHARVLRCLTDDVTWYLPGQPTRHGKREFDAEIENEAFEGSPKLTVARAVEESDTIVITGEGEGLHREQGPFHFAFATVFDFRDTLICRVESYVVPLP
ncbi:MAG: nuclear transport factor 2 family protein [Candidatus Nanopelagicales bacterium]